MSAVPAILTHHRRALGVAIGLLAVLVFLLVAVGRHPEQQAPATTLALVGDVDAAVARWAAEIRAGALTVSFKVLNFIGAGIVTIPVRIVASAWLLVRRRFVALSAFVLTWVASEVLLSWFKVYFHRGRPPGALVETVGFSFP
ncbi:MAG TPA: hypothetical protein VF351_03420, partial [Actinomycetota bacterium]